MEISLILEVYALDHGKLVFCVEIPTPLLDFKLRGTYDTETH